MARRPEGELRRGWTTGACATAAAKAAYTALLTGDFPDPVQITLPKGETPSFALAREGMAENRAFTAIIKDAGDDPDVTHSLDLIFAAEWWMHHPCTDAQSRSGPRLGTVSAS